MQRYTSDIFVYIFVKIESADILRKSFERRQREKEKKNTKNFLLEEKKEGTLYKQKKNRLSH